MRSPRTLLTAWNLHAKKKYGQNFLSDPQAPELIVTRSGIGPEDTVIEIGSGMGALTLPLARKAGKVYAIEKDTQLVPILKSELLAAELDDKVEIITSDILKVSLTDIFEASKGKLIVMGNLPYNISSQILIWLVRHREMVSKAVFMFQKELAERIASPPATPGYGRLSAVIQYCAKIRSVAVLGAGQFYPRPQVDSEVIEIDFFEEPEVMAKDEDFLFSVIKAAFGKRRKNLRNSLSKSELPADVDQVMSALQESGIDHTRRAETLTIKEFVTLSDTLLRLL